MGTTVAVLGASGVYARHLLPLLTRRGLQVRALARRPETATVAHACGAEVQFADLLEPGSLAAALRGCDVVVNLATTLPGPRGGGDFAANDRLRREGTPILVTACREAGVPRLLQQSISMVNSGAGAEWADEDTCLPADDSVAGQAIAAARDMEEGIRGSGVDWLILRGGLFYGPGTGLDDDWFERARSGRLRLPGDGEDYVSLVRVEDMAAATAAAVEWWPSRQTLIVADDEPAPWRDVLGQVATMAGAAAPVTGGRIAFPSWRVRNTRARAALGWEPFFATYRSGLIR
ncbi:NAD-dependent epimerase/dehydratase family protein [Hamadaea tsunoensis]|uniref:NAD-dependent epimerase/dehydratase family protein n=1 Tax=Hamadaea tsunoensis TaxID=53368 RepID=UPI00041E0429|nr:NAD(P)H-binding protein [Hamadaea tsunoensis]